MHFKISYDYHSVIELFQVYEGQIKKHEKCVAVLFIRTSNASFSSHPTAAICETFLIKLALERNARR